MNQHKLFLFGRPRLTQNDEEVSLPPRAMALLAYIARQPGSRISREMAHGILWPDEPPGNARHNLRQILWSLRQALGEEMVSSNRGEIGLSDGLDVDVQTLLDCVSQVPSEDANKLDKQVLGLYQGLFMQGFENIGGIEFEDWLLGEREYIHRRFARYVLDSTSTRIGTRESVTGAELLERLLKFDPLDEAAAAELIALHLKAGEKRLAFRVYRSLADALERELGADPPAHVRQLVHDLLTPGEKRSVELRDAGDNPRLTGGEPQPDPSIHLVAMTFVLFQTHEQQWKGLTVQERARLLGECHYFAQRLSSRFGVEASERRGDGHLFLFGAVDAAADFGLKLWESWQQVQQSSQHSLISLRIAAHVGEAAAAGREQTWIGRGVQTAQRMAHASSWAGLTASENLVDLLPESKYSVNAVERVSLPGDHLPRRTLYSLAIASRAELPTSPEHQAEALFLKAASFMGSDKENGPDEEAIYREVIARDPDHAEAHNNLAVLLRKRGSHQEAAVHYRSAIALRPGYPEAHYNYGVLLESLGNTTAALDHYRTASQIRPDYVDAHLRFAILLVQRGQLDEANLRYERVLQLRPGYAEAHNNYAILLEDLGDRETALYHYQQAIREKPDYVEAHYNLALHFEVEEDREQAEKHYRAALGLRPDFAEARHNLATLLYRDGNVQEALAHYRHAIAIRPNDPETNYNYAVALEAIGEHGAAEAHFRVASEFTTSVAPFASTAEH